MYQIVYYTTERGDSPVKEFLNALDKKSRAKAMTYLSLLEKEGPNLKRPYADHVSGKLRELRIQYSSNEYRILYFFYMHNQIVLLHAFSKKTQQLREHDIDLAERRMEAWIKQYS